MIGIAIKKTIGIGDALQFSSLPENYFRAKGEKLIDVDRHWFFDHNPYIERTDELPSSIVQMWNFSPRQWDYPNPRVDGKPAVYLNNAEIWASLFKVPAVLSRPRIYQFEDFPFEERKTILFHTDGISHGEMPQEIIDHVLKKYTPTGQLFHFCGPGYHRDLGIPRICPKTLWEAAEIISQARMFIGLDSGPSWIAACYPDVIIKKVRTKPRPEMFKTWVPLEIGNIHAHWDSREHMIFNPTADDIGFTWSYLRI